MFYVANSFGKRPTIMAFDLDADRKVAGSRVFFDGTALAANKDRKGGFDDLVVDRAGNVITTLFVTPDSYLGRIITKTRGQ
ncbi:MAG TPA: hypothetical protein VGF45_14790 [Polyangia bacterium]